MNKVLIFAVGYESRSLFVAKSREYAQRYGLLLPDRGLSWRSNSAYVKKEGILSWMVTESQADRSDTLSQINDRLNLQNVETSVDIDISSMPRWLIAEMVLFACELLKDGAAQVSFVYSPGKYSAPVRRAPEFFEFAPLQGWEGWTSFPERPSTLVAGLGFERNLVLGALEELDPSGTWLYVPKGADDRFDRDVKDANLELFELVSEERVVEYPLLAPVQLTSDLGALCRSLVSRSRVNIVLAGPKIFSLAAIIVALEVGDEVSLWRASWHSQVRLRDVEASGSVASMRFKMPSRNTGRSNDCGQK